MYRGLQISNIYLFLFVFTVHALLLANSFHPYSSRGFMSDSALIVELRNATQGLLLQRKSSIKPQVSTSSASSMLSSSIPSGLPSEPAPHTRTEAAPESGAISRQKIHGSKPIYPLSSRRLREEGLVLVKLCVNPRGAVEKVDVIRSSGYQSLDNSALHALVKWKFAASLDSLDSNALDCFRLPVQFTLEV